MPFVSYFTCSCSLPDNVWLYVNCAYDSSRACSFSEYAATMALISSTRLDFWNCCGIASAAYFSWDEITLLFSTSVAT